MLLSRLSSSFRFPILRQVLHVTPRSLSTQAISATVSLWNGQEACRRSSGEGFLRAGVVCLPSPFQKRTFSSTSGNDLPTLSKSLKLRGIPFRATEGEVLDFLEGYNPIAESLVIEYYQDGKATGFAYIGFSNPEDADRAVEALDRKNMGSRYVELFPISEQEHRSKIARSRSQQKQH